MLSPTATAAEVRQVNTGLAAYIAGVLRSNRKKFSLYNSIFTFRISYRRGKMLLNL
jgi:hypothetical protein